MATKTITITESAYDILASHKVSSESFSEEITRILKKKNTILDLAGAWSDISDKEAEDIKKTIKVLRQRSAARI